MDQDPREISVQFKGKFGHFEAECYDSSYRRVTVTLGFSSGRIHLVLTNEDAESKLSQSSVIMLEPIALEMCNLIRNHFEMEVIREVMDC
jgi:hypothetical protein